MKFSVAAALLQQSRLCFLEISSSEIFLHHTTSLAAPCVINTLHSFYGDIKGTSLFEEAFKLGIPHSADKKEALCSPACVIDFFLLHSRKSVSPGTFH